MNETRDRVNRGGGWYYDGAAYLAARARHGGAASYRLSTLGFRCVRSNAGSLWALRGGSWNPDATDCRAASRRYNDPVNRDNYLSVRCWRNR